MSSKIKITSVAKQVPFDNSTNGFVATETQSAIEELFENTQQSASPGFSFGRSGNTVAGTYLLNESVPSNKAGRQVALFNAQITQLWTNNEDISTYTLEIYEHDGNEVNITLLTSIAVVAARSNELAVSISVNKGKQLAARVGSGTAKNVIAGLIIKGSLVP